MFIPFSFALIGMPVFSESANCTPLVKKKLLTSVRRWINKEPCITITLPIKNGAMPITTISYSIAPPSALTNALTPLYRYFPNSYSYFKPFPRKETQTRLLFWLFCKSNFNNTLAFNQPHILFISTKPHPYEQLPSICSCGWGFELYQPPVFSAFGVALLVEGVTTTPAFVLPLFSDGGNTEDSSFGATCRSHSTAYFCT